MAELIYLVGPPAVGKLTLAQEISRRRGAVVVDNHLISDPVFVPMAFGRGQALETTDLLRERVFDVVLAATRMAPSDVSHIFTNWLQDRPAAGARVEQLRAVAADRGARFVPVWLDAQPAVLARRVGSMDRSRRAKIVDPQVLTEVLGVPRLPAPDDALVIDTSQLTCAEVADLVETHLGGGNTSVRTRRSCG